jgi:hypothetical protein
MSLNPHTVARALGGEARGNQVSAPGPGHESKGDRSLSILIDPNAPDGFVVNTFAGDDPMVCKDYVRERLGLPAFGSQDRPAPIRRPEIVREYVYEDERGDPYLKVARTRDKAFLQSHWQAGKWVSGAPKGRRIPYRLPELLAAPDAPVFVVEGEKDADNLAALGFVATTSPMGAGKWAPAGKGDDLSPWFAGRDVTILPDNDDAGRAHARDVAAHLIAKGATVRIVDLPDLPPKGDVSDWLDAGGDRAGLEALRASARRVTYDDLAKAPEKAGKDAKTVTPWQSRGMDAATLWRAEFPPVRYLIEGVLPEGLTLLAGKPKLGKSWLTLDIALAVATGGNVLGKATEAGDVLFLALEDNKRRLQARMKRLFGHFNPPDLSRMLVATDWAKAGDGCVEDIRSWSESVAAPRLVVIDTLGCIRGASDGKQSAYQDDVAALRPLHALANEKGFAIVVVHHVRKMEAEDPLDQVSGTTGLAGTADTILVLDRRADTGLTLRGRGRDLENEIDLAMNFDRETCRFSIRGDASEVKRSTERSLILSALKGAPDGMSPQEVAAETGMNRSNVKVLLPKMVKAGEAMKAKGRGCYLHPDFADRPDPEITDYLGYPVTNGLGDSGEAGGEDGEPRDYGDSW